MEINGSEETSELLNKSFRVYALDIFLVLFFSENFAYPRRCTSFDGRPVGLYGVFVGCHNASRRAMCLTRARPHEPNDSHTIHTRSGRSVTARICPSTVPYLSARYRPSISVSNPAPSQPVAHDRATVFPDRHCRRRYPVGVFRSVHHRIEDPSLGGQVGSGSEPGRNRCARITKSPINRGLYLNRWFSARTRRSESALPYRGGANCTFTPGPIPKGDPRKPKATFEYGEKKFLFSFYVNRVYRHGV